MVDPPEVWVFVATKGLLISIASALTLLSYFGYREGRRRALAGAVAGFTVVTIGTAVELVELGLEGQVGPLRNEIVVDSVESVVLSVGLLLLVNAVTQY
jgi:hypothetical protein